MDWVIGAATVVVTAVGLWLANSYRRQVSLTLAQTRLKAYSRLWELTGVAAPTRLDGWGGDGYLRPSERSALWAAMTDWYYANGAGMLLTAITKEVYLNVKHNLVCKPPDLRPAYLADRIKEALPEGQELDDQVMGIVAIKLISLLRTQLKSDLAIYGPTYSGDLTGYESFFLEKSGAKLRSKAWATAADKARWGLPRPLKTVYRLLHGKPRGSPKPALPRFSQLLEMPAAFNLDEVPLTPPSSRAAVAKALSGGSVAPAQADSGIPKALPGDNDVEN